jgi:radical SAM superfamily enzyme YgiQ (UPF0313 family)
MKATGTSPLRIYLINPRNSYISLVNTKHNRLNKYRIWKPLGLLVLARVTPPEWDIKVIDENLDIPDYSSMPRPDLVGLTAFTSQADRAYELATIFRSQGIPVVMGGIHATMCRDEALKRVDSVVTHEGEEVWPQVLRDVLAGTLKRVYDGSDVDVQKIPPARHDLLTKGYAFGSIQTTRGCPLNCSFCSVTTFNGNRFRLRPVTEVIDEFRLMSDRRILVVDDNLVGTSKQHIARSKELFRAMIAAKLGKKWICQATLNMGEDEELARLAAEAGCFGVLIGFESVTAEGLTELNKKFNIRKGNEIRTSVRCLQRQGISVMGSFIFGLDVDRKGVGLQIAQAAEAYGLDSLNMMFMTPLPGTRLWKEMEADGRIGANSFPDDWKYYTLNLPTANYMNLSWDAMVSEFVGAFQRFYAYPRLLRRVFANFLVSRKFSNALTSLVTNVIYRRNLALDIVMFSRYDMSRGAVPFADRKSKQVSGLAPASPLRPRPVPVQVDTSSVGSTN